MDSFGRRVHLEPGVVLDQLSKALLLHGLIFGADVATGSPAMLGGTIGITQLVPLHFCMVECRLC